MLTPAQLEQARTVFRQWRGSLPPCGISDVDIYNPCLPERFEGWLECVNCGLRQRPELEASGGH